MSKSLAIVKSLFLQDPEGYSSKIIDVRGVEAGLDYLEITTQSRHEKEIGIKTIHKVFTLEASI